MLSQMLSVASDLEVQVAWAPLPEAGRWIPECRLILIDNRLTARNEVCTLAHELGHAHHNHQPATKVQSARRLEEEADEYAASLLIRTDDYARAEALVGTHPGALAEVLDVNAQIAAAAQRRMGKMEWRKSVDL